MNKYDATDEEFAAATEKVQRLADHIIEAMDEFSKTEKFTIGDAMSALFAIMMSSAMNSPEYDAASLVEAMDDRVREAVGMTKQ